MVPVQQNMTVEIGLLKSNKKTCQLWSRNLTMYVVLVLCASGLLVMWHKINFILCSFFSLLNTLLIVELHSWNQLEGENIDPQQTWNYWSNCHKNCQLIAGKSFRGICVPIWRFSDKTTISQILDMTLLYYQTTVLLCHQSQVHYTMVILWHLLSSIIFDVNSNLGGQQSECHFICIGWLCVHEKKHAYTNYYIFVQL